MLSRSLKRALLDSRWPMPPPFLLPWAANLTTVSHAAEPPTTPPPMPKHVVSNNQSSPPSRRPRVPKTKPLMKQLDLPALPPPNSSTSSTLDLSPSLREMLPLLKAQTPHYITAHIHGKPYLITQGDTVKLPFLMRGVEPGDVLRLNRAVTIGSRDYTLKPPAPRPKFKSPTTSTSNVLDPTSGQEASFTQAMPTPSPSTSTITSTSTDTSYTPSAIGVQPAPHFIPHIAQGKHSYIDERLFVCRAVVMGVESEPLRIKEKTKRRQRRVKRVKSKHRFTILRIKEVRVRGVEEVENGELD